MYSYSRYSDYKNSKKKKKKLMMVFYGLSKYSCKEAKKNVDKTKYRCRIYFSNKYLELGSHIC